MNASFDKVYDYTIALEISRVQVNTSDPFVFNKMSQPLCCIYVNENLQILTLKTYVLCYFQREALKVCIMMLTESRSAGYNKNII